MNDLTATNNVLGHMAIDEFVVVCCIEDLLKSGDSRMNEDVLCLKTTTEV